MASDLSINKRLIQACRAGRIQQVRKLVDSHGLSYSLTWSDGYTLLREALKNRHSAVAKFLLLKDCKINSQNKKLTNTPLHLAIKNGDTDIVQELLTRGANLNITDRDGKTPLHVAIAKKCLKTVRSLLEHGAYVDSLDGNLNSVLHSAVKETNSTIVNTILEYLPNIHDMNNRISLKTAMLNCKNNYIKYIPRLFQEQTKIVESLLKYGFNVDVEYVDDWQFLHAAVQRGYFRVVEDLVKRGADVRSKNYNGISPIFYAVENNDLNMTKLLLNNGANADTNLGLVKIAIQTGSREMVEIVLPDRTDINVPDECGSTLLYFAPTDEIVDLLVTRGANVDIQNKDGWTALHNATKMGYLKVVKALLKYGAKVDFKNILGKTSLHIAAHYGDLRIAEILLQYNANLDSLDICNQTPLFAATICGHEEMVVFFLKHGSDINIANTSNVTPLQWVFHHTHEEEIITILQWQTIRLKTANLYASKENIQLISSSSEIDDFEIQCKGEIQKMQNEKIGDSIVSFYDILRESLDRIARYARNKNIVQVLESEYCENKFPIYCNIICNRLKKGVQRKELLERGYEFVHSLPNRFSELSHNCIDKIFYYLSNEDLKIFINAGKPIDVDDLISENICYTAMNS